VCACDVITKVCVAASGFAAFVAAALHALPLSNRPLCANAFKCTRKFSAVGCGATAATQRYPFLRCAVPPAAQHHILRVTHFHFRVSRLTLTAR